MDRSSSIVPSPTALKALTHPVRVRMLGLLRMDGPATATTLAVRLGLNTGATSYHLRQLAQHGFVVEDAELGTGRDRWWRAAHQSTRTELDYDAEGSKETIDAYLQSVAVVITDQLQRAVEERPLLPHAWRDAWEMSDWVVRLTPSRVRRLLDALSDVIEAEPDEDDEEAVEYRLQVQGFPVPGRLGGEDA